MPTLWQSWITAAMKARLNSCVWSLMREMKSRSIFTMSAGIWVSIPREE